LINEAEFIYNVLCCTSDDQSELHVMRRWKKNLQTFD